jgi:DNA polymerase III sliding clamp (beta) subunit (PCNA family)
MVISKESLQEALGIVKPGLTGNEIIEQTTSFAFIGGNVVTYNDEISLSHPVEGLDFEGAIKSDKLYQFLTKTDQDEIQLEIKENELLVTAGKARVWLTLQSEIRLPLDEELSKKGKWKDLPENFIKFVVMCIPSCSTDLFKPLLGTIHVTREGIVEASDGYRITHCVLSKEMPVETFLIPSKSAKLMIQLKPVQIAEGRGWMHFRTETGTVLSCRILEFDKFPNTLPFLNVEGERIVFPRTISEVVKRAEVFSKDLNSNLDVLQVEIADNLLVIKAKTSIGRFEETVNMKYKGDPIIFQINPGLLQGILSETQEAILSEKMILFNGEGWKHLVMLIVNTSY